MSPDATAPPVSVKAGEIQFVEACLPPLAAGDYVLSMHQDIHESNATATPWNAEPYTSQMAFAVDAPRFSLAPTDIHSVYPPANQAGAFTHTLPNVVFTRRTLPWERGLDGKAPQSPYPAWMALLLIAEDELPRDADDDGGPRLRPLPVVSADDIGNTDNAGEAHDSLLFPSSPTVLVPDLGQNGQAEELRIRHAGEQCLTVDLPLALFSRVAPRRADLPWLSHVRQIDTGSKEVYRHQDRGWFSVIIGNRLPGAGDQHALLVSLEGLSRHLPGEPPLAHRGEAPARIRLAVLGHWRFRCNEAPDFKARLANLDPFRDAEGTPAQAPRDAWLRLPCEPFARGTHPTDPDGAVNAAFARGYTGLDHRLRHGERTLSWYRGPLIPLLHHQPRQVTALAPNSDSLLRYDPEIGMFDASYAAAWQLGRLLALQNHGFAQALERTRVRLRRQALARWRRTDLERRLGALGLSSDGVEASLMARLAERGPVPSSAIAEESDLAQAAAALGDGECEAALAEICTWLGRLVLLYGVPFRQLVPEPDMLPPESLRTFFLDPLWIHALIQGAMSLGNTRYGDFIIDRVMNQWLQPGMQRDLAGQAASGIRSTLRAECEGRDAEPGDDAHAGLDWPLTGVLLRSGVVAGWRGLEIEAFGEDGGALPALRIEQLGEDVLMALYNGRLHKLVIRQPREGLHFGLTRDGDNYFKWLKDMSDGQRLDERPIDLASAGALRADAPGVIEIDVLAAQLGKRLKEQGQLPADNHWGSAQFALQMIDAPGEFSFVIASAASEGGNPS